MKLIKEVAMFLLILFLTGCTHSSRKEFYSYRQSPEFIKTFLSGLYHGEFSIAEKGEDWESGCTSKEGDKTFQFISASMDSSQYKIYFWGGGLVGKHKESIIINFQGNKVISYAFGSRPDEFKKVGPDE